MNEVVNVPLIYVLLVMSAALMLLLAIMAGIFFMRMFLIFKVQARLVYNPTRIVSTNPGQYGLDFQDITYRARDGTAISAWFIPAKNSRKYILFCHGNYGNISGRKDFFKLFHRLGLNVFIFDYRGYGNSQGRPSEEGTYMDAEGAWNYLVEKIGAQPAEIVIFGRSLGGAVATWLAGIHPPRALILECAFTSIPDMAADMFRFFPAKYLTRYRYPTQKYIQKTQCPVLIIHSPDDKLVPFSHGKRLFELAGEPKRFLSLRGGHNEAVNVSRSAYHRSVKEFMADVFGDFEQKG